MTALSECVSNGAGVRALPVRRIMLTTAIALVLATARAAPGQTPTVTPLPVIPDAALVERDSLTLFRRELPVGVERYELRRDSRGFALYATIQANNRGTAMPAVDSVSMDSTYAIRHMHFRGAINGVALHADRVVDASGAMATISDGADSREVPLPSRWYTLAAHVPASGQEMLLRYWLAQGRPDSLPTPGGSAIVVRDHGVDTVVTFGARVALRRYSIDGVTWGREVLWLDDSARVFALAATTAGIAYQLLRSGHEDAIARIARLAIDDQLRTLAELTAEVRPVAAGTIAIVGARLIDGTARQPIDDVVVVVRDGRIASVGRQGSVRIPPDATVIDAHGRSVLPGLWDMHAHFGNVEWGPAYLGGGVTTVRDVGNVLELETAIRDTLNAGRGLGPRMLLAGLVDGPGPDGNGKIRAATPDEARAAVRLYHDRGFQQMKLYNIVPPSLVPVFTAEAHRLGMTVTGHVPRGLDGVQAVEAGMDGIEHIQHILRGMVAPESLAAMRARGVPLMELGAGFVATSPEARRATRLFVQHHTVLDPTLALIELLYHGTQLHPESLEPAVVNPPQGMEWMPLAFAGSPEDSGNGERHFAGALAAIGMLHAAGATIVAGTDVGVPVHSLHHELELFVRAGFTPLEAIAAATSIPARVMGMANEVGTVAPGMRADLIIVAGDPSRDIRDLRRVERVMAGGRMYDTAALWRIVGFTR